MKITISEDPDDVTMKLEGRIVGPWVQELERTWRSLAASLGMKKLLVDLRGINHIAPRGTEILSEIYSKTRAAFLADTPITKYYAEQARAPFQNPKDSGEAD